MLLPITLPLVLPAPPAEIRMEPQPSALDTEMSLATSLPGLPNPSALEFFLNIPMDTLSTTYPDWADQTPRLLPQISSEGRYRDEFIKTFRGSSSDLEELIVHFGTASHLSTSPSAATLGSESIADDFTRYLASAAYPSYTQSVNSSAAYIEGVLKIIEATNASPHARDVLTHLRQRYEQARSAEDSVGTEFLKELARLVPVENKEALGQIYELTLDRLNDDFAIVGYFLMGPKEKYRLPEVSTGPMVLIVSPDALINQIDSGYDFLGKYLNEVLFYQKLHAARELGFSPVVIEGARMSAVESARSASKAQPAELFTRDPFLVVFDAYTQSEVIVLPTRAQINGIDWERSESFSALRNYEKEQQRLRELFEYLNFRVVELDINVEGGDYYSLRTSTGRYHLFSYDGAEESNMREAARQIEDLTGVQSLVLQRTGPTSDYHNDFDFAALERQDGTYLFIVDITAFTSQSIAQLTAVVGTANLVPYKSSFATQLNESRGGGSLNLMQGTGAARNKVLITHPDEKFEQLLRHHGFEPIVAKGTLAQGLFIGEAGPHCLMQQLPRGLVTLNSNLRLREGSLITVDALQTPPDFETQPSYLEKLWQRFISTLSNLW